MCFCKVLLGTRVERDFSFYPSRAPVDVGPVLVLLECCVLEEEGELDKVFQLEGSQVRCL